MSQWIKVKDKLPKTGVSVLVWTAPENAPESIFPIWLRLEKVEGKVWWDDKKDREIPKEAVRSWRYVGGYLNPKIFEEN